MAWIELHDTIATHPKTYALMDELNIKRREAVGLLVLTWTWAIRNAQDGNITAFPPRAIADAADWHKNPKMLIDALVKCGWVDNSENCLILHDWDDFTWRYLDKIGLQREQTRKRVKEYRERKKPLPCNACNALPTLHVTQCNTPTVPNQTKPNRTIPNLGTNVPNITVGETPTDTKNKRFTPPSFDMVSGYCQERNNGVDASKFIDFYTAKGWYVGKNPMRDWKAAVRTWENRSGTQQPLQPRKTDLDDIIK